jgi:hypothetical protein
MRGKYAIALKGDAYIAEEFCRMRIVEVARVFGRGSRIAVAENSSVARE